MEIDMNTEKYYCYFYLNKTGLKWLKFGDLNDKRRTRKIKRI